MTSVKEWSEGLKERGIRPGTERISELLKILGDPQDSFKTVHIAGSDGKGSISAMMYSILRSSGKRAGMFTSPHISKVNECISFDGTDISDAELNEIFVKIMVAEVTTKGCTFFEVLTAAAFLYFKERNAEYAVIEAGMGGKDDATNVIVPDISIITHIEKEHTAFLGNTEEEITRNKAGIIKSGVPVVTVNNRRILKILEEVSRKKGSELFRVNTKKIKNVNVRPDGTSMEYCGSQYEIGIAGTCQAENAAVAIEASRVLRITENAIGDGLKRTGWKGRMEHIGDVILDVAHTKDASMLLSKDILKMYGKVIVVFGVLNDKNITEMSKNIASMASDVIVTQPDTERALSADVLETIMKEYHPKVLKAPNVGEAMDIAEKIREARKIVVTGSFYMAGDVRKWLRT